MKKAIKKITAFLLALALVFTLSACNGIQQGALGFFSNKSVVNQIDLTPLGDNLNIIDYDTYGAAIAVLYSHNGAQPSDEDCQEVYSEEVYAAVYSILRQKIVKSQRVRDNSFDISLTGDGIKIFYSENECAVYDKRLTELEVKNEMYLNYVDLAQNIPTIDASFFVYQKNCAYATNYVAYNAMIFYDTPYTYYIEKQDKNDCFLAGIGKKTLTFNEKTAQLAVKDYENACVVNTVPVPNYDSGYVFTNRGVLSDNYAVFDTMDGRDDVNRLYYWNYGAEAKNTLFERYVVYESEVGEALDEITQEIKELYGIDTAIKQNVPYDEFLYNIEDCKNNARNIICLYDLKYCLSTFPKEFYSELLCRDIEDAVATFDKLNIYLIGRIKDEDISAFETNKNDEIIIVYSVNSFSYSTFCHELMHACEYRIWNYEPYFDNNWYDLNPNGFEYSQDYKEAFFNNPQYEQYFFSEYGTSDIMEDRATVFEMYYDALQYELDRVWLEREPLGKKVMYLNEVMAKSFPSLNQ